MLRVPITELEARLAPLGFFRTHRQILVNVRHVRGIRKGRRGRVEALLSNGHAVPVGRTHRDKLEQITALRLMPEAELTDQSRAAGRG
jgi:DNA-binding LytR/AlgR family response regulator